MSNDPKPRWMVAGELCRVPSFQRWILNTNITAEKPPYGDDESNARWLVKRYCGIRAKRGIESSEASQRWDALLECYRQEIRHDPA